MFNTTILDVAIGMVFIYLLLSLLCSATNEMIELILKKRATDLERGIRGLLEPGTPSGTPGLVQKLYNHPLVNSLFEGTYDRSGIANAARYLKGTKLPSYIPARNFALALMDLIAPDATQSGAAGATAASSTSPGAGATQLATLRAEVQKLPNVQVKTALTALIDAAGTDVSRARMNIEEWFNSSMDRVSGWYKRRSHTIVLVLGLLVAIGVNADSVLIVRKLASDRPLRDSLVAASIAYAQENAKPPASPTPGGGLNAASAATPTPTPTTSPTPTPTPKQTPTPKPTPTPSVSASPSPTASPTPAPCVSVECKGHEETAQCKLKTTQCQLAALGLPIGWSSETDPRLNWKARSVGEHFEDHIFGWLLTALAISLGAPFWFDILNKFIVIRSTVKPKEKSPEEKSKD